MKSPRFIATLVLAGLALLGTPILADHIIEEPYTFGFIRDSDNSSVGDLLADFFFVSLSPPEDPTSTFIEFRIRNKLVLADFDPPISNTTQTPAITRIFFFDTSSLSGGGSPSALFDLDSVEIAWQSDGVKFERKTDPNGHLKCPDYMLRDPDNKKIYAFVAVEPQGAPPTDGIGPGERLDLRFDLLPGKTVEDVRDAMDASDDGLQELQICIHVQAIEPGDESETYVTTAGPTAVELISFSATSRDGDTVLRWRTAAEIDNLGFDVYRALAAGAPATKINVGGLIPARGSLFSGADYTYVDRGTADRSYVYYLVDVDASGAETWHGPVGDGAALPSHGSGYVLFIPDLHR